MRTHLYLILMAIICLSSLSADKIDLKANPRIYSAVVIGSGPGALTSAIYLQRAGIETLVIEGSTPGGAITQSPGVHNWPGEIEISGEKLIKKIRLQAEHNGTTFVSREVTYIDLSKRPYTVTMRSVYDYEDVVKVQANAVIVATGSNPKLLGIPGESGEQGYWTRGVYNCAVCDGGLYKGKTVAVIGGGDSAIIEADYLSKIAKKVYVILRSEQFRTVETLRKNELVKKDNVEVINNTNISEISGDGKKVTHLNLSNEKALPVDGVFVAIGATPNTKILNHQLELDHRGYVCLVDGQQTSVPGVFAVGDIVDPIYKQAVSAAGDGAKAALQAEHYLASIKNESLEMQPQPKIFQVINPGNGDSASDLISEKAFYDAISEGQTPLVVDFYSPYCNPCKTFGQSFQEAAQKHHGKARFLKVDVTQFPQLAQNYGVYSLPTLMVFDINGKQVEKASGLAGVKKSINKLDRFTK